MPVGVATLTTPEVALAGTTAVISVSDTTAYVAGCPLNVTLLAPVKPLPRMMTVAPVFPPDGCVSR